MPKTEEKSNVDVKADDAQDGTVKADDAQDGGEAKKAEPSKDLKVVVTLRGGIRTVGIQRPGTDPYIESFEHRDLADVLEEIGPMVDRAVERWEDTPMYPAYKRPKGGNSSNRQTSRRRTAQTAQASTSEETSQRQQQTLF